MTTISVIYPRSAGATFDYEYYERTHLPLVIKRLRNAGLLSAEALRGVSGLDGSEPAFLAMALLRFQSLDRFGAAMAGSNAAEIMADIANFTSVQPMVQVNETIGG